VQTGDNNHLIARDKINEIEMKSRDDRAPSILEYALVLEWIRFDQLDRGGNGADKFAAKSRALAIIPFRSFFDLSEGSIPKDNPVRHLPEPCAQPVSNDFPRNCRAGVPFMLFDAAVDFRHLLRGQRKFFVFRYHGT